MGKKRKAIIVQGADISINHGAIVQLRNGKLDDFWYYTDQAGSAARSKEHGFRLEVPTNAKQPDKQIRNAIRLDWVGLWFDRIAMSRRPHYAGLEDYAVRAEQGAHYLGEVGGMARRLLWLRGVRYRLHEPGSVKMFTAHDGTAQKDLIEECVEERWGADFSEWNQPTNKRTGKENRQTSEDLADAFAIAKMIWIEYQLRMGWRALNKLHEKELRVFNRATKAFPINVLGRDWIHNPAGNMRVSHFEACNGGRCALKVLDSRGLLSEQAQRSITKAVDRVK